jgi:hypothetical protein
VPNKRMNLVKEYRGKGLAKFSPTADLPCHVFIEQAENGIILIKCVFYPSHSRPGQYFPDQEIQSVNGQTDEGLLFKTRGRLYRREIINKSTGYFSITLMSQEVILGEDINMDNGQFYIFNLVNFEFLGNTAAEKRAVKDGMHTIEKHYLFLKIEMPWGEIAIHPLYEEKEIMQNVRSQKGIAVTCEARIHLIKGQTFAQTIEYMDEICRLLSLARGTKINWISADCQTQEGGTLKGILRESVIWPFCSLTLIDPRNPVDTVRFVETTYPIYLQNRRRYNLDIAIEQFLDAKRETAYLETRGLAAAALIDSLQQMYGFKNGIAEILHDFDSQKRTLRDGMRSLVQSTFPQIGEGELQEVLQKLPELNRKSFLTLLKIWTDTLGLNMPNSELIAVRNTRNSLAHSMQFKSTDQPSKIREYFRLVNLIDLLFLKVLNYSGPYIRMDLATLTFERAELP